jgi:hypothetical protein
MHATRQHLLAYRDGQLGRERPRGRQRVSRAQVAGAQQLDQRVRDAVPERRTRRRQRKRQFDRAGVTAHTGTSTRRA